MNTDELQKCIDFLTEVSNKFELQISLQIQCAKETMLIVSVQGLQSMAFSGCENLLKCCQYLVQCIEMQSNIVGLNDELNKLMVSMRS